ncbi:TetR/AcrR family transcriptional regulator [Corynebacterium sp. CCM 9185]|uniref:Helix-turn-helix transcriptional regulator n=1 Tax=Corynebacterium marambiense TaxID=2765364 RepID=A0ABS0W0B2_9CORY|nr:TetR/AcrR family transcriptional regulator [Corynebacterium marambiense]MBI9001083.1 helix-turn-helix transcriptional regulator [Corynebacterium marambiense]MCK7664324.1 TetR/AcrR family transcriptional regulator [Corynebacterium marambiense]MCX7543137.1 TetR/AcrR family transcriptional regulator [Corynebacterium marambiense]
MRPSKRDHVLKSAIALIEEHGLNAVSLESVTDRAGISKGGLMYHFPTRQELLLGIAGALAEEWEQQLRKLAGGRRTASTQIPGSAPMYCPWRRRSLGRNSC